MKNIICSILAVLGTCTFLACSNGEYVSNSVTLGNSSSNPLDPKDSAKFDWGGSSNFSVMVNGASYSVDSTHCGFFLDTLGGNVISAVVDGAHAMSLRFENVYGGNTYTMGYLNTIRMGTWSDTIPHPKLYYSFWGNVGQVQILRNDASRIIGKFYFQCADTLGGTVVNVQNGWFNIPKY